MAISYISRLVVGVLLLTVQVFGQDNLIIEVLENCNDIIPLSDDSNGYLVVRDVGVKPIDCKMAIKCSPETIISARFLEINFPACDQSVLEFISMLGDDKEDQYPVFESRPHFCGKPVLDVVDFDQYGERQWNISYRNNQGGSPSYAIFAFSVHLPDSKTNYPWIEVPQIIFTTIAVPTSPTTTVSTTTTTVPPTTTTVLPTTTTVPTTTTTVPTSTTTVVPPTTTTAPTTTTTVPTTTTTVPTTTTTVPTTTTTVPTTTTTVPTTSTPVPTTTTTVPTTTTTVPTTTTTVPTTTTTVPTTTTTVPTTTTTVPTTTTTVPTTTTTVPTTTTTVPTTTTTVPITTTTVLLSTTTTAPTTTTTVPTTTTKVPTTTTTVPTTTTTVPTTTTTVPTTTTTVPTTTTTVPTTTTTVPTTNTTFRCTCPISISDLTTNTVKGGAPVVYLEKGSHLLLNITSDLGTKCDNNALATQCHNKCYENVYRFYRSYGPNRLISINRANKILGDHVCQQTSKMEGALTAHYQILECQGSSLSAPIYTLDNKFFCYQGAFCSHNYRRQYNLPTTSTYATCTHVKAQFSSNKRCSCLVGISKSQTFELKMAIEPKIVTGDCQKTSSECQAYCKLEAGYHINKFGGLAHVFEEVTKLGRTVTVSEQINDLLCDQLGLPSASLIKSSLYSQVQGCVSSTLEGAASSKMISLVNELRYETRCD